MKVKFFVQCEVYKVILKLLKKTLEQNLFSDTKTNYKIKYFFKTSHCTNNFIFHYDA